MSLHYPCLIRVCVCLHYLAHALPSEGVVIFLLIVLRGNAIAFAIYGRPVRFFSRSSSVWNQATREIAT